VPSQLAFLYLTGVAALIFPSQAIFARTVLQGFALLSLDPLLFTERSRSRSFFFLLVSTVRLPPAVIHASYNLSRTSPSGRNGMSSGFFNRAPGKRSSPPYRSDAPAARLATPLNFLPSRCQFPPSTYHQEELADGSMRPHLLDSRGRPARPSPHIIFF